MLKIKNLIQAVAAAGAILAMTASAAGQTNIRLGDIVAFSPATIPNDPVARDFMVVIEAGDAEAAFGKAKAAAVSSAKVGNFLLGYCYEIGIGVEASFELAEKAYRISSEAGYLPGTTNLAVLLMRRDPSAPEAGRLLKEAAEKDPTRPGLFYGIACLSGATGTPDMQTAAQIWNKAAAQGEVEAYRYLGLLYSGAFGFPAQADPKKAVDFLEKGAGQGDAEAAIMLARLILAQGEALEREPAEAAKWFEKAAESEAPAALHMLAQVKEEGIGAAKPDPEAALALYEKAAAMDHGPSVLKLGLFAEHGKTGGKDQNKAVRLYRKAAELNEPGAFYSLGIAYRNGAGVAKDEAEAFRNFVESGLRGFPLGATQAGVAYLQGNGVAADPVAAAAWFLRAAEAGESNAMVSLAEMMLDGRAVGFNAELLGNLCQRAFDSGNPRAGYLLGRMSELGVVLPRNPPQALAFYRWSAGKEMKEAAEAAERLAKELDEGQLREAEEFLKSLDTPAARNGGGNAAGG